jgi:hypothetical protein
MGLHRFFPRAVPLILALVLVLVPLRLAVPQARQPFPEDAARQLVRAGLLQYFDASSVFEISLSGAALAGDILTIEELTIEGKPAVVRGFGGEMLARFSGLHVDTAGLAAQQMKPIRTGRATVVARSTAKDVQEGLVRISPNILSPTVRFQTGRFEITATIRRGDKLYPAQASGSLVVDQDRQRVRIAVAQALAAGSDVPSGLIESELAKVNPVLDLSRWPLNLVIQRLVLHNDRIELLAGTSR